MFFHTALLKNIKNSITSDATILLQSSISERYLHSTGHHSIHRGKRWKEGKFPSTDEWIQMWHAHIVEFYAAFTEKEILPHAVPLRTLC